MEQAIAEGAQVLFTTTAPLIAACRKVAVKHRDVHILNCSVSMPYPGVRTYYSRIYEGKFISGAIAGAMCKNDTIGYIASNPIFGVPAGINAFALGARLTNPNARVLLKWSCVSADPIQELLDAGVDIISNRDVPGPALGPVSASAGRQAAFPVVSLLELGKLLRQAGGQPAAWRLGGGRRQRQGR